MAGRGGLRDIPVLIAGGGPVGLTASLLLSQHGVRSPVERHPGTAILPEARGINAPMISVVGRIITQSDAS